jgi:hypothetical protein
MRKVSNGSNRAVPMILTGAFALAAALLIAGTTLTLAPGQAQATPEFTKQTGKPCGFCHVNPGGGGKLKPEGESFKKKGNKL